MKTKAQLVDLVKFAQEGHLNSPEILLQIALQLDRLNTNFERMIGYTDNYRTAYIKVSKP